jgi:hypothetical protein
LERRQLFGWNEQRDAPGLPGLPLNEAASVERHDHAMNGGRRDAEEILKIALSAGGRRCRVIYAWMKASYWP